MIVFGLDFDSVLLSFIPNPDLASTHLRISLALISAGPGLGFDYSASLTHQRHDGNVNDVKSYLMPISK